MKKTFQIYILILFCSSFAKAQIIEFEKAKKKIIN